MAKKSTETTKSIIQLVIDGKAAQTSVKELGGALSYVNTQLRQMKANDPKRDDLIAQKRAITAEYQKQKEQIGDIRTAWQKFKTEFATIATGVVGGNAITFVTQQLLMYLPQLTAHSLKLKDELANVAKTTNMTDSEVEKLNETLKTFSTRTTTSELRQLAAVGGQFGVAKEEIDEFVGAADKIGVAIGDQFGGVENAAQQTLLLRNILGDIKSDKIDQDLLRIGNGLNVLEADGAATAPVMADLTSRMGGVLNVMGVAAKNTMGMSATLQELNVTAERGGTAVVEIFQRMTTESATFAKVAGLPLQEYEALIRKDIWGAFLLYLQGLQKVSSDNIAFNKVLEQSKLTGSGVSEVLGKLSSNMTMLNQKTALAGEALQNTDSIMAEFQKRNHALALGIKQLSEFWNGLIYSSTAQQFVEDTVGMLTTILGLRDAVAESNAKFQEQKSQMDNVKKNIIPLIAEYEKLTAKNSLSNEEHSRLKTIIQQVGEAIPEAVSGLDAYGKALDINTERAREAIRVQEQLMKHYNKTAIEETEAELKRVKYDRQRLMTKREQGQEYLVNPATGIKQRHQYTREDFQAIDAEIQELSKRENELSALRAGLTGTDTIEARRAGRRPQRGTGKTPAGGGGSVVSPLGSGGTGKDKKGPVDLTMSATFWQETVDAEIQAYADLDEQVAEERKKGLANLLKDLETEYDTYYLSLEQKAAQGLMTEEELAQLKKQKEIEQLNAEILFRQLYDEDTLDLEREVAQKQIEIAKETADQKVEILKDQKKAEEQVRKEMAELEQAQHKAEVELQDAKHALMQEGVAALMGMAKQQSGIWKALFLIQKGMAIAEIITKAQLELASYKLAIAGYSAQIAATGGVSPVGWAGIATTTAQMAATKMGAAAGIATIAAQAVPVFAGREAGGAAPLSVNNGTAAGYVDRPTLFGQRAFVAGEGNRREYIVPWRMMQDPVVADMVGMIESVRPRYYSSAGNASAAPAGLSMGGAGRGSQMSDGLMIRMIEILTRIEEKSDREIDFNFSNFERKQERLNFIRKDTSA
jgi:TP901 family phage tail tape measure protein